MRRTLLVVGLSLWGVTAWSQTREDFTERRDRIERVRQAQGDRSVLITPHGGPVTTATVTGTLNVTTVKFREGANGEVIVVGEAVNKTGSTLTFSKISFDFYTSGGAYIGSDYTYTFDPTNVRLNASGLFTGALPPGGVAFFMLITDISYALADQYAYASEGEVYGFTPAVANLELGGIALRPNWWGGTDVSGNVTNTSDRALTYFSTVSLAGNDSSGQLRDVTFTYVNGISVVCSSSVTSTSGIAPLGSVPFDDYFLEAGVASIRRVAFEWDENALTKGTMSFGAAGGNDTFQVMSNCAWAAVSNVPWITVTAGAGGQYDGTVSYSVAPNNTGTPRTGRIHVGTGAGVVPMTVTQAASACGYALSAPQTGLRAKGGRGGVGVTAGSGCSWNAVVNLPWVTITGGASGTGNGATSFTVAPNPHPVRRTGTLTVAGQTHLIVQDGAARSDFQGDSISDVALFRPSSGAWYLLESTTGAATGMVWGASGDTPVAGDYDGDGATDAALYRVSTSTWFILPSSTGIPVGVQWGATGDTPVPADYDGDGRTDVAVYRALAGVWYIVRSSNASVVALPWGQLGDIPLAADFDGDGKADPTVFRPSTGTWFQARSTSAALGFGWGQAGDVPLAADFDGDGKADPTIFRPSTGAWYELRSTTGAMGFSWGQSDDVPVANDFDGDGFADPTVFRASTGTWYQLRSKNGASGLAWGAVGDVPIR